MRCFIGLILLFLSFHNLLGQINKGRKLLSSNDYEAALTAFENDIEKPANKPVSLYEIARIYYKKKYKGFNLKKSYTFACRSLREFKALSSSNKKKVQKKGVNSMLIGKLQQNIIRTALKQAQQSNTIPALQNFIDYYTLANKQQQEKAYQQRNLLIIKQAKKEHNFIAYKTVWENYQKNMTFYNPEIIKQLEYYLLESFINEKGWAMYPYFEELYPDNPYVKDKTAAYAYLKIRKKSSIAPFQRFIEAYPNSPFVRFAQNNIFALTMAGKDLTTYDAFVRAYPEHEHINKLWKNFYALYAPHKSLDKISAFAEAYPSFPFSNQIQEDLAEAQRKSEEPFFLKIIAQNDITTIVDFIQKAPNSTYIPKMEEAFYKGLTQRPLLRACKAFLTYYPNSAYYDKVLEMYYKEYVKDGELGTLNQFMMEHPEYKNLEQLEKDLKIAEQGAKLDLSKMATNASKSLYEAYILAAAPKERAFVALQRLLEPAIRLKKWQKAQSILAQFEEVFKASPQKIQQLKTLLVAASKYGQALPNSINSDQSAYVVDVQKALFFARNNTLYESTKTGNQWTPPIQLPIINEGIKGDAWTFNAAKNELVYTENGDLYYRILKEGQWSSPIAFSDAVNRSLVEQDAQFSVDGQALLYSSESDQVLDWKAGLTGKNFHGTARNNSDLFVLLKNEEGQWSSPINLGDQINSPFAERYPYLHSNGKTLFFSSEGHGGLGGLDIYYSQRLDDSWKHWSTPVNIGTGVNSVEDEGPCAINPTNELYFTRQNEEGNIIYHYSIPSLR